MTLVVAAPTGCWPFNHDRMVTGVAIVVGCFSRMNKMLGRTKTRTRDNIVSRHEQFETSPDTIEKELRPVVC